MTIRQLYKDFTVCKVSDFTEVDLTKDFVFLAKTDDELSLVCETADVPSNTTETEHGWKALKIEGVLDFSLIGIIAGISAVLAQEKISLFVVSTFNTDYILIKKDSYDAAVRALRSSAYEIS